MFLSGEIYNISWGEKRAIIKNKHFANNKLTLVARLFVGSEIIRISLLDLESEPFSHHSHTINRINYSFGLR